MEIAHISDLHVLASLARVRWRKFFNKRVIGGLNLALHRTHPKAVLDAAVRDLAESPPDHLVVTGDLTNLALDEEFEAACAAIREIGLPAERLSVIPGNHDTYTAGSRRARRFEQYVEPLLEVDALSWPRVQRLAGDVLVVSTCSGLPTPWFTAYGRLGREQLQALDAALGEEAAFKIVLVHHPPILSHGRPDKRWRNNRDGQAMIDLCLKHEVGMLLCGHTHGAFRVQLENPRPFHIFCAGSTTKEHGATYNRYLLEGSQLIDVGVRRYDPSADRFVRSHREPGDGVLMTPGWTDQGEHEAR